MGIDDRFGRTELLVGTDGVMRLSGATVAMFGLGGVGSYAVEAIARAGAGHIILVDFDRVALSNLNRQLFALESTIGCLKVEAARERIHDIHPGAQVDIYPCFAGPDTLDTILSPAVRYAVDAIDSVSAKIHLLTTLHQRGIFTVSCMGAANKLSPQGIRVSDIGDTRYCPLARVVRQGLRKNGITRGIQCIYSEENQRTLHTPEDAGLEPEPPGVWRKTRVQGSISYVPALIGLTAAGVIIQQILSEDRTD